MEEENNKNLSQEFKEFLTVSEVTKYLGVNQDTVYRYMNRHKRPLPRMRISNRKILIRTEDLKNWLEEVKEK